MLNGTKAAFAYFAAVFLAGFAFGTLRLLVLVPHVGDRLAVLIELPFMLTVSWLVSRSVVERLAVSPALSPRLTMGGGAFALLMAVEAGLAMFAFGRTFAEHIDSLLTAAGLLGLAGQAVFASIPVIQIVRRRAGEGRPEPMWRRPAAVPVRSGDVDV